jgi:hypothetical protein
MDQVSNHWRLVNEELESENLLSDLIDASIWVLGPKRNYWKRGLEQGAESTSKAAA